jgi:ABC-type transport system involved in multi-copper enzyme maturation permease subunit
MPGVSGDAPASRHVAIIMLVANWRNLPPRVGRSATFPSILNGPAEIGVIWWAECRRSLRSARTLVLLALYGLFSAVVLLAVGAIAAAVRAQVEDAQVPGAVADAALAQARSGVLGLLVRGDEALLESLERVPLVALVVFKVTLFFLPAYVALMGFDQVSGEVGPRSIRYVTVRARRSSLLLGKFLAQASVLLALVLAVNGGLLAYSGATQPDFPLIRALGTLVRFGVAALVFSLAYVALTTLCSSLFRAPAVSLVFNYIALFSFWLLDVVGAGARRAGTSGEAWLLASLRWLSPSSYAGDLLHPQPLRFGASCAAYVAFALVFLGLAHLVLRRRDL